MDTHLGGKKLHQIKLSLDDETYALAELLAVVEGVELAVCIRMILEEKLFGVSVRLGRITRQLKQADSQSARVNHA